MNTLIIHNKIGFNFRRSFRRARRFYRKNRLHEALSIITELRRHGYNDNELILLTAMVYDRLTILTSEAEYEELALETYEEIIRYSGSRRYIKKALKLQNLLIKNIYSLNENEQKAQSKAEELKNSSTMSPKAWYMLAANFSVRKDPLFVVDAYKKAVELNEKYISALYRLGYVYHYNLGDRDAALGCYLKAIKILPYEDSIESESTNVKTLLEACTEVSEIYSLEEKYGKVISVFDHAFKIFTAYGDICRIEAIRRIINNAHTAAGQLGQAAALKKHVKTNFGYDFDAILEELRIE